MFSDRSRGRRIVILCEGDTEELVIRHFVARQWYAEGLSSVGLHTVNLNGKSRDIGVKASLYLDEQDVLGVFTLFDLYAMGQMQTLSSATLDVRVNQVQALLKDQVQHARSADFFPHLGVHETEAWILAEGNALAKRLGDANIKPDPQAELKDFQRPPSKIINELFLTRRKDRYQKIRDGRPLLAAMVFDPVYQRCSYFRGFYNNLRSLAQR